MTTASSEGLRTTTQACQVHARHMPASHLNHRHHVWPLGEGGPDIDENTIVVCPTGHSNIHRLLHLYRVYRGEVPYQELRVYAFQERETAQLGWERMQRGAM